MALPPKGKPASQAPSGTLVANDDVGLQRELTRLDERSRATPTQLVDCATVRLNDYGSVEVVLLEEKRGAPRHSIESLSTVVYDPRHFMTRQPQHEQFRLETEALLRTVGTRGTLGRLSQTAHEILEAAESADPKEVVRFPATYASYEAIGETITRTDLRADIHFLGSRPAVRSYAMERQLGHVPVTVVLSASMSLVALADLLHAWKILSHEVAQAFGASKSSDPA